MGEKLSPPLLNGTIPAFYSNEQGKIVINIPYTMNRAVSFNQINGFQIKIKSIQSSTEIYSARANKPTNQNDNIEIIIENNKIFKIGQFYKIQMAYINEETIGYYSTVAIAKYTKKPLLSINGLNRGSLNAHNYTYTGIYDQSQNGDKTERVYSYQFNLYNSKGELIDTSGELLHDTTKDDSNMLGLTEDTYTFSQDLNEGETYKISYKVNTVNGLSLSTIKYNIIQKKLINLNTEMTLSAALNYNNGYVDLYLNTDYINTTLCCVLSRSTQDDDYKNWKEIYRFSLDKIIISQHLLRDFTVEQGKTYKYSIQQYNNNNLYTNRILSNDIKVEFEDAFLFDGEKQLKIKYNPKVSSLKKDLLETKTDTIGGKYPFIFRNGQVYYSEFPISGLISYWSDEENLFLSPKDYLLEEKTTNLTEDNIAAERLFKIKVLEWLTDGKPKIFRSPTEGNYIVRLMNSSLTPNETVGRMLHTFNSTAYEIADFNYENLQKMNFIFSENQNMNGFSQRTIEFSFKTDEGNIKHLPLFENILPNKAESIKFNDMTPGDIITIVLDNGISEDIKIGVTGSYYINIGVSVREVKLNTPSFGSMTYTYTYIKEPQFNYISNVEVIEIPQRQFIGMHNILDEITKIPYDGEGSKNGWIENPKIQLEKIYKIIVEKRPLQKHNGISQKYDPFFMYYSEDEITSYLDGYNHLVYSDYQPFISINNNTISVNEIEKAEYDKLEKIIELMSYNGAIVNLSYCIHNIEYNIENTALEHKNDKYHYLHNLGQALYQYNNSVKRLENNLKNNQIDQIDKDREEVDKKYQTYIEELIKALEEERRRRGEIL